MHTLVRHFLFSAIATGSLIFAHPTLSQTTAAPATPQARLGFFALNVADLERSVKFYTQVLGLTEQHRLNPSEGITEVMLGYGNLRNETGLMLLHDAKRTTPYELGDSFNRIVIYMPSLQTLQQKLTEAKAQIVREPVRNEAMRVAIMVARDPEGHEIEFIERIVK